MRALTELVVGRPQAQLAALLASGGYLPVGVPMLKRILALPGETVCRRELVIIVDGVEVGAARSSDHRGRPLPDWQGCRIVGDGQIFLMNWQSDSALDGRYFGLTAMPDVRRLYASYAKPLRGAGLDDETARRPNDRTRMVGAYCPRVDHAGLHVERRRFAHLLAIVAANSTSREGT